MKINNEISQRELMKNYPKLSLSAEYNENKNETYVRCWIPNWGDEGDDWQMFIFCFYYDANCGISRVKNYIFTNSDDAEANEQAEALLNDILDAENGYPNVITKFPATTHTYTFNHLRENASTKFLEKARFVKNTVYTNPNYKDKPLGRGFFVRECNGFEFV